MIELYSEELVEIRGRVLIAIEDLYLLTGDSSLLPYLRAARRRYTTAAVTLDGLLYGEANMLSPSPRTGRKIPPHMTLDDLERRPSTIVYRRR